MCLLSCTAFATTWTVDDSGGSDFDNIQAAVDVAIDGDEIVVMPGTYTSTANDVVNMVGKAVWLHSIKGAEVTIIDGEGARRGIVCESSETGETVIEGFMITGGYAITGGGLYNYNSSPAVTNCTFENNIADSGGGMCNYEGSRPTLTNCTFENNTADSGGGMYNWDSSSPTITNCTFTGNTGSDENGRGGGGMCNYYNSNPTLENCTFENNTADSGGGIYSWAGSSPTLTSCTFTGNTSTYSGGGMYNWADSSPTLTNCTFTGNIANYSGGGMYNWASSSPAVTNCTFTGNAANRGGGMCNYISSPALTNCTFENNTANSGGGIYNNYSSNPTLTECTLTDNTANNGSGVYISESSTHFFGANTSDELYISSLYGVSSLAFSAESTCDITGSTYLSSVGTIFFDIDAIETSSSLNVSQSIDLLGGLVVSNNSTSLSAANVGDIIPLAQASTIVGSFDSIVFPLMPGGLGLQLIEYPSLRGGDTEMGVEVIEVEGANFDNPFSGDLDRPPVDIISFDADGDGADEVAVLFEGAPGGVVGYNVSQDGVPTPIDGLGVNVGNNPVSIDATDVNNDGREDLIVANSTDNSISVLLTMEDIDGLLYFDVTTISVPGSGQAITCVAAIDWDNDSDLDAVVGVDGVNTGYQILLDISGAMTSGPWFGISDSPTCVDGGNQSGEWGFVGGTIYGQVHRGTSVGSLQLISDLGGNNTVTIEAIELDEGGGDGQIDLIVSSDESEAIYLFQGNEAESDGFGDLIPLGVSSSVEDLVALDADDDGDIDMVITAPASDTPLVLLRNDGGGSGLVGGLNGITWSMQAMDSDNPLKNISGGTLGGKDEKDDWIVGTDKDVRLRGKEMGTMEQTNIQFGTPCPSDLDGDGEVRVADLLILLAVWGPCPSCDQDLNFDGIVDVTDLLIVVGSWGPCE